MVTPRRRHDSPVPADFDAERDTLGAMMLSRDAVVTALDIVTASDFHHPAHRLIAAAIEGLAHREQPVDPGSVSSALLAAGRLDEVGGRGALLDIQASTPASSNARRYASVVAKHAALRRALAVSEGIRDAVVERDLDTVEEWLRDGASVVDRPLVDGGAGIDGVDLNDLLDGDDEPYRWVIPNLMEYQDRLILTGTEGAGKSTVVRQILLCAACGIHPFRLVTPYEPARAVHVDLENSLGQNRREYRRIRDAAGIGPAEYRPGMLTVVARPAGIDLSRPSDERWLYAVCERYEPDILSVGPLYKAFRGSPSVSKQSEEAAEVVSAVLDRVRVRFDTALVLEAHTTHDAPDLRPRGSRLWEGWPEFGFGLKPHRREPNPTDYDLIHWRGMRDRNRAWPDRLHHGRRWPWTADGAVASSGY